MNGDQALKTQNRPQIAALVGLRALWQNPVNATTKPGLVVAVTEYWWRKWLPILGWARWFLVTMLRWAYLKQVGLDGDDEGKDEATGDESGVMQIEITGRELAGSLGMTEKELYRLLASEPIEGEEKWRRLRLPSEGGYKQYEIRQVEALRLFIPRLRYLYRLVKAGKPPQRLGFILELLMDDVPTPEDAERLRALIPDFGIQGPESGSLNADFGTDEPLNAKFDTQGLNANFGIQGPKDGSLNADFGTNEPLSSIFVTHACLHANDNKDKDPPPTRQPRRLSIAALKNQYPVQPDGLDVDQAFNLALDRALALLPSKLRARADVPFYTLAAELHQAALECPSRTWPDAGGAGWVLDAVLDAIANGPVGSVNLIRAITDRWLVEGNPYALGMRTRPAVAGEGKTPSPFEQAVAATWRVANGQELAADGLDLLVRLLGPEPEQADLTGLLTTIVGLGRRAAQVTPDLVETVVTGRMAMPPLSETTEQPAEPGPEPRCPAKCVLPDQDPVLGEVVRLYEAEVGAVTEGVARKLLALTEEYRDLGRWRRAFDAVVGSNVRRLDYLEACLENDGRPKPKKSQTGLNKSRRADPSTNSRPGSRRARGQRGRVVSPDEMPEVEPEEPLPLP